MTDVRDMWWYLDERSRDRSLVAGRGAADGPANVRPMLTIEAQVPSSCQRTAEAHGGAVENFDELEDARALPALNFVCTQMAGAEEDVHAR